jgi:phosphoribosylanthranilate isomerase
MRTFVKICGICSRDDLEQICALDPDAIGFVFWPKSKRYVRPAQIKSWLPYIPSTVKKVGVFVEPDPDEVEEIARECQLDVVQIHLTSNEWKMERPIFEGLEVWISPRMEENLSSDVLSATNPEPAALLADSFDPNTIGGTGTVGNWDCAIAMKENLGKPLILAGGLTSENVSEAVAMVCPWGVDVSSGVEKEPGVKDIQKVREFISAARM